MNALDRFYELLAMPDHQIKPTPGGEPPRLERFYMTGHRDALPMDWAPAFGMWGGCATAQEIGARAGKTAQQVLLYAQTEGLVVADRGHARTHAQLAVLAWCDRHRPWYDSAERLGVWPGERALLCSAAQVLVEGADGIEALLRLTPAELERRFAGLNIDIRIPRLRLQLTRIKATS